MAMYGAPGTPEYEASQRAIREEAERKRQAAIAAGQPLETEIGSYVDEGFLGMGDSRVPISAFFLDPALAGNMTEMEKASFYDQMRRSQMQGQDIYGQQQNFANALYQRSQGLGGPSVAEMQLQQSLNANRQDAARTLAGAGRGINPALARRLLMQQQGSLNQTAAGQAAILRAQEQQAAQTAYGSQLNNMRGTETSLYGTSGQLGLNQAKAQSELVEAQKARDLQLAIENQRAAQKASGQASTESEGQANRDATRNNAAIKAGGEAAVETAKAIKNAPPAPAPVPAAHGGFIRKYADGGKVSAKDEGDDVMASGAKGKGKGKSWKDMKWSDNPPWLSKDKTYEPFTPDSLRQLKESGDEGKFRHWGDLSNYNSMMLDEIDEKKKNEKKPPIIFPLKKEVEEVPEMLKRVPTPSAGMPNVAHGGKINAAMGRLTKMDNEKNDVIPAMLSPGEIVIPRSIVSAPNAPMAAHRFVEALLANKGKKDAKMLALKAALGKK